MPQAADFVMLVALAVLYPAYALGAHRLFRQEVNEKQRGAKQRQYWRGTTSEWVLTGLMAVVWYTHDRPLTDLGLRLPTGWRLIGSAAIVLALAARIAWEAAAHGHEGPARRETLRVLRPALRFLPKSESELQAFTPLAFSAGICEEVLYRGYVMWLLGSYAPIWIAVVCSSAIFGCAHLYRGVSGALRTGGFGLALGTLFVVTDSLWAPMLVHALLDLRDGVAAFVTRRHPATPSL